MEEEWFLQLLYNEEVNFILIKALIELLQVKIFLNNIYTNWIPLACATLSSFFHYVIQHRVTRPTGTICSVNARVL